MPRLYLHIGTHKTGTTSLQRFLAANRDPLRRQGIVYPDPAIGGFRSSYAHHHVAHAMAERTGEGTPDDARRFFDALRRDLRGGEVGVVSAEALYRHVLPGGEAGHLYDAGSGAVGDPQPYVERVRECLGDVDVTVLVVLRRQDAFLESLYAEQVMATAYRKTIDRFTAERAWMADYDARLATWAGVFGADAIRVRTFEASSFPEGIERSFVEWVGGRWDDRLASPVVHNVTLPRVLVEYKRAVNGRQPRSVSTTYRRWLEDLAATTPEGTLPDLGRYHLSHSARLALVERFAEGNRRVAERWLGRPTLFEEPGPAPYPDPPPLRHQHFRLVTKRLLRSLA